MDFSLNDEQQMIVKTTRDFVVNELYPHEKEVEETGELREDLYRELKAKAIDAGLYAANMPADVGGAGLDTVSWVLYEKELGRANYALHWSCVGRPSNILLACRGEQRERYLLPAVRGDRAECLAMTEPGAGSDLRGMKTNRKAIEVVKPLESALVDGEDPIQGMAAGSIGMMKDAEKALKASEWGAECEAVRTEYPARDLSILDLLPPGISKGWALERLAARLGVDRQEIMAIGDNWNDATMLEWAGQGIVMANAAPELRALAKTLGWKEAPSNDEDGVAVVLEAALARLAPAKA